jgi:hypothetical protein
MFDADQGHHRMRRVDWRIEYEFNKVFMPLSKNGKEALIKRGLTGRTATARKRCGWRSKIGGGTIGGARRRMEKGTWRDSVFVERLWRTNTGI